MAGMKPRHAAALALVGWYLMVPPTTKNHVVHYEEPISGWQIIDSFDTAQACKDMLTSLANEPSNAEGW
jgi:hypothetical protein